MEIRDAFEADAERMADLAGSPADVMRNLIHDRTVRVATEGAEDDEDDANVVGFVSFDAQESTVHVTQLEGDPELSERLLKEPTRFAAREGMIVELLVPEDDDSTLEAAERANFEEYGPGPRFDGMQTTRYRWEPGG